MTWLSIVIPTYNRVAILPRAIASCIQQSASNYEVIVVDDGSTDGTADLLAQYRLPKLRVVTLRTNLGVSAARMAGVEVARGEWVLFLDSDDELLPNALSVLQAKCREVCVDIARIACMYVDDDGQFSPQPWMKETQLDYESYIRWTTKLQRADFSNCIRRKCFDVVRFPAGHIYETQYHLDFAKQFKTLCCDHVIGRVHFDAPDRLSAPNRRTLEQRLRTEANSRMGAMSDILARHGAALETFAPSRYSMFVRALVTSALIAGKRRTALYAIREYGCRTRMACALWGAAVVGIISPQILCKLIARKYKR